MDKLLSIRKNKDLFSLFLKIQDYQQSANRTDIVNAAIQKALYDRESGCLNWQRIALEKTPSVHTENEDWPAFIQLRVDEDKYGQIAEQIKADFSLEKVSPASFVVKLLLKNYLLFLNQSGVEILTKKEETHYSMEDFRKLSSNEKLNAIYGLLLGNKNWMASTKLKIIEWNINGRTHCNIGDDIIETIKKQEADIIVLTEVPNSRDAMNFLEASLKETYRICLGEQDNQSKYLVLVLIRYSMISPDSDPIVQNGSKKGCNLLTVRFSSTNKKEYFVVGCRMTTGGKDLTELYDSERGFFDTVLIPAVKKTCGKDEICIIAGDFNNAQCRGDLKFKFNPKDYEGKAQLQYNLNIVKDAFEEIGFALADNTKNGIQTFRYGPNRTIPNDHIFVKGCHVRTAYPVPVHESLSDHDIICAEISIE